MIHYACTKSLKIYIHDMSLVSLAVNSNQTLRLDLD